MTASYGIVLPLWHYETDDGRLLERAVGEVGLDHVTVPGVTGPVQDFRLDATTEQPHFTTPGGWHYPSEVAGTRDKRLSRAIGTIEGLTGPRQVRRTDAHDAMAALAERARRLKIGLVLRVDVRAAVRLLDLGLQVAQRNAWGQPLSGAGACACHPDARELLRATLDELGRYDPQGFELLHWLPDHHVDRSLPRPLDWHPAARRLLDICFCAACRQIAERAGVDAGQAARAVRVQIGRLVERQMEDPETEACSDPVVEAYQAVRAADCADWLIRLPGAIEQRGVWLVHDIDTTLPSAMTPLPRVALISQARPIDECQMQALLSRLATEPVAGLSIPVWRPAFSNAPFLVRLVAEATRTGIRHFDFEELPTAAPCSLTWLRQAVRFARRG